MQPPGSVTKSGTGSRSARTLEQAAAAHERALAAFSEGTDAGNGPLDATAAGLGPGTVVKRLWARLLRPIVWKRETHEVAVRSVGRRYRECDVLPRQRRAFRASQRGRAMWLGRVERAWAAWTKAVLLPPKGRSGGEAPGEVEAARAAVAAAEALQRELAALRDGVGWGVGGDFRRSLDVLAATVAVAGTFVAATPAPAPPVHDDEELARSWDDWARQAAARLQLHRGLLAMRTAADAIGGRLIGHWKETVQGVDAVLDQIKAALNDGVKRAGALPEVDAGLRRALATEQERTARTLGRPIDTLNDPAPFLQDLARHAEEAVEDLDDLAKRVTASPGGSMLRLVILEGIEHLYMRGPGGGQ